jgi:hypothetical protein
MFNMKITKAQSKQLRYICGAVEYNQPCTRKYTGGSKGKIREIGKFKYIEREGELLYFEYDGDVAALSKYTAEEFLSSLADDAGFCLGGGIKVEDFEPGRAVEIDVDCVSSQTVDNVVVEVTVPPQNDVHEVNVPVQVEAGEWMDADGNDPDDINQGMADTPELLTEEEKKGDMESLQPLTIDTATDIPPVKIFRRGNPEPLPAKEDRWGEELREVAMTAAAREAAKDCGIEGVPDTVTSVDIVRTCYTTPGFMDIYGECLKKVGNPRSLEEIAKALPAQRKWLFK